MMMTDNATQVFKETGYVPQTEGRLVLRCTEIRTQNRTEASHPRQEAGGIDQNGVSNFN